MPACLPLPSVDIVWRREGNRETRVKRAREKKRKRERAGERKANSAPPPHSKGKAKGGVLRSIHEPQRDGREERGSRISLRRSPLYAVHQDELALSIFVNVLVNACPI